MAYTYNEFVNQASSAGMMDRFGQSDLETAKRNPEYGISLLGLMKDVQNATSEDQRLLANEAANQLRKSYGVHGAGGGYASSFGTQIKDTMDKINGYGSFQYGGEEGYQALKDQVAEYKPFQYGNQETYDKTLEQLGSYGPFQYGKQDAYDTLLDRINNFGSFLYKGQDTYDKTLEQLGSYGQFQYGNQEAYDRLLEQAMNYGPFQYGNQDAYQNLLDSLINQQGFRYNPEEDESWKAAKKQYLREGERASANALAQASAVSGGVPSTYAMNAAQQAGNYYASALTDLLPSMEQNAYSRYLGNINTKLSSLSALEGDRNLAYQQYLDQFNQIQSALGNLGTDRDKELNEWSQGYAQLQNYLNQLAADRSGDLDAWNQEFAQLQTALGNLNADRDQARTDWAAGYDQLQNYLAALGADRDQGRQDWSLGFDQLQNALNNEMAQRDQAYAEWVNQYNMLQNSLGNLQSQDEIDYGRYLDQVGLDYQAQQDKLDQAQQEYENALALYNSMGYATEEVAKILGVEAGKPKETIRYVYGSGGTGAEGDENQTADPGSGPYEYDYDSMLGLGYGDISVDQVFRLVDMGAVEMYLDNGMYKFRRKSIPGQTGTQGTQSAKREPQKVNTQKDQASPQTTPAKRKDYDRPTRLV